MNRRIEQALQHKKEYGNREQVEYVNWLAEFARRVYCVLKTDGSFVVDLAGSCEKGIPSRGHYNFRVPIKMCDELGFFLAEDVYGYNPSKLQGPIEWVNTRKIRAKDNGGAIPSNLLQIPTRSRMGNTSTDARQPGRSNTRRVFPRICRNSS